MLYSLFLTLLFTDAFATCTNSLAAGTHSVTISSGGKNRQFDIYVPYGLVDDEIHPAIFTFHGYASNPSKIANLANTVPYAESYKWYAIFPKGSGFILSFNGAGCCAGNTQDDVGFARNIIAWLEENTCVDTAKVFSTGFSNGGFMTHRLACEASDVFAAFAPHSGLIEKTFAPTCSPQYSRPILALHGTADGVVPFFGNGNWNSFSEVMDFWTQEEGCTDEAAEIFRTDSTHCIRFDNCNNGVPVEYCDIAGLAHTWSGSNSDRPQDIDATAYIFMFFSEVDLFMDDRVAHAAYLEQRHSLGPDVSFSKLLALNHRGPFVHV
jgi:polyhydroxybutyrate depolymerase